MDAKHAIIQGARQRALLAANGEQIRERISNICGTLRRNDRIEQLVSSLLTNCLGFISEAPQTSSGGLHHHVKPEFVEGLYGFSTDLAARIRDSFNVGTSRVACCKMARYACHMPSLSYATHFRVTGTGKREYRSVSNGA